MGDFLKEIRKRVLVYDGSKGYMLQKLGLKGGECGESWNITRQQTVKEVYKSYIEAGADVIQTNTFTGSRIHLKKYSLEDKTYEINYWGAKLAREAAGDDKFVCASIGPAGVLFEPSGQLTFSEAYDLYCEQSKAVMDGGADAINFETFTDLAEMRAALMAAKDTTNLPVICSFAFENNGRTLMGAPPFVTATVLKALGADIVGANCSFGAEQMLGILEEMYDAGGGILCAKPNAGLPKIVDGATVYTEEPEHFAEIALQFTQYGAGLIGGCCGTTPEFIKMLSKALKGAEVTTPKKRSKSIITSGTGYVNVKKLECENVGILDFIKDSSLIKILESDDISDIDDLAIDLSIEENDAVYIAFNSEDDNAELMSAVVDRVQWYIKAPIIIETCSPNILDSILRIYRGVAGVAICKCPEQTAEMLSRVAEKYGSVVVKL